MEVQYNQKSTKGNSASNAMPAFNITEKILRILKHFYVNHPKKYRKGKWSAKARWFKQTVYGKNYNYLEDRI